MAEAEGQAKRSENSEEQAGPANAEGSQAALETEQPAEVETLRHELAQQQELAKRHLDGWKRAAADLENYRKRVEKEQADLIKFGHAALVARLLSILDDLERAFQTMPAPLTSLTWIDGIALIDRKLRLLLEGEGLGEIEAVGKTFDPAAHQAVLQEETDACPDGQVMAVLQRGYTLHERLLRPAMVKVARQVAIGQSAEAQPGGTVSVEPETEIK